MYSVLLVSEVEFSDSSVAYGTQFSLYHVPSLMPITHTHTHTKPALLGTCRPHHSVIGYFAHLRKEVLNSIQFCDPQHRPIFQRVLEAASRNLWILALVSLH